MFIDIHEEMGDLTSLFNRIRTSCTDINFTLYEWHRYLHGFFYPGYLNS